MEMGRRNRDMLLPKIHAETQNLEESQKNLKTHLIPQDWVVCTPHQASQSLGPALKRQASEISDFENQ